MNPVREVESQIKIKNKGDGCNEEKMPCDIGNYQDPKVPVAGDTGRGV